MFSGAKHTVSDQRARLKSITIELLKYLKSWFQIEIFTEEDLYAIINTMDKGGMKALKDLEEAMDY